MKESDIKKTIDEWIEITGIIVMDPDGFDRKNLDYNNDTFTFSQFMNNCMGSTIKCDRKIFSDIDGFQNDIRNKLGIDEW